jgi:hypothetical protein
MLKLGQKIYILKNVSYLYGKNIQTLLPQLFEMHIFIYSHHTVNSMPECIFLFGFRGTGI